MDNENYEKGVNPFVTEEIDSHGIEGEELTPESVAEFVKIFKTLKEADRFTEGHHARVNQELVHLNEYKEELESADQDVPDFISNGIQDLTDLIGYDVQESDVEEIDGEDLLKEAA